MVLDSNGASSVRASEAALIEKQRPTKGPLNSEHPLAKTSSARADKQLSK
jgi:hypothetical protein